MSRTIAAIATLAFLAFACARQPTEARSSQVISHFFKKYAKKYPNTIYATSGGVQKVEILDKREIHKHLVAVRAFLTLKNGDIQKVLATLEKGPMGWRFVSWENATE